MTARVMERGGPGYRLPTEAEWEYACRAGSTTTFYFGDSADKLREHAWYGLSADAPPQPVGMKKPNPWGLYDVYGNVSEWCGDWHDKDYYEKSRTNDPTGPDSGSEKVVRGGSRSNLALCCRSAYRNKFRPAGYGSEFGFRVVLGVPPKK
jgi:formylglycine-generating enzyme required for sulfatase activity